MSPSWVRDVRFAAARRYLPDTWDSFLTFLLNRKRGRMWAGNPPMQAELCRMLGEFAFSK
jgi:hypothetical protein